jgi:hypothetical protein
VVQGEEASQQQRRRQQVSQITGDDEHEPGVGGQGQPPQGVPAAIGRLIQGDAELGPLLGPGPQRKAVEELAVVLRTMGDRQTSRRGGNPDELIPGDHEAGWTGAGW